MESVDTIDRRINASTGELITRRLITCGMKPPAWLAAVGFPEHCYVLEETRVNPKTKDMALKSVNVTGNSLIEIQVFPSFLSAELFAEIKFREISENR